MNSRGKTLAVRMAVIEAVRYGRKVLMYKDGELQSCSLGPDGDLLLTPIKTKGAEITFVSIDEAPTLFLSGRKPDGTPGHAQARWLDDPQ